MILDWINFSIMKNDWNWLCIKNVRNWSHAALSWSEVS